MAESSISQQREHACVPRDHLPQLIQASGVLKKSWFSTCGPSGLFAVHGTPGQASHGQIVDAISISDRPAELEDRAVPGHWKCDLLAGSKNSHIATLVERHSRFVMLIKVPSKDTTTVVAALSRHVLKLPAPCGARSPGTGDMRWPRASQSIRM